MTEVTPGVAEDLPTQNCIKHMISRLIIKFRFFFAFKRILDEIFTGAFCPLPHV
jgi:hypothetical protein